MAITATAITAGVIFARMLRGAGDAREQPDHRHQGPARLARHQDRAPRPITAPVYLRTTSLDVYDDPGEQSTSAGIHEMPVSRPLPNQEPATVSERVPVTVTIGDVGPGAVLVPAPYLPISVSGPASDDPRVATSPSTAT